MLVSVCLSVKLVCHFIDVFSVQMEEQAQATDRLATIEKLQTSVSELKDCCATLEAEKSELQTDVDKLKTSLSFAEENLKLKHEEVEQLTAELQQVCTRRDTVNVHWLHRVQYLS